MGIQDDDIAAVRNATDIVAVISEHVSPFNQAFRMPSVAGAWNLDNIDGIARAGREVERQASMIGYINAFYLFAAVAISVVPFIFFLKRPTASMH